jgi:hypothetical protein
MRWPWMKEARLIEPKLEANPKVLELQTAKEILAEVFHARPSEVEEMIQMRLEERSWETERAHQAEDGLWPQEFCLGE